MQNAVIYGKGVVGSATAEALGIEKFISRTESNISYRQAAQLRYHVICLPTPVNNGRYFTDDITTLIKTVLDQHGSQNIFILRSTVSPGTTRQLTKTTGTEAIVHVPEFLSETTAVEDAKNPDIVVIGGDRRNYRDAVAGIFRARYKGTDIFETDSVTAELIKTARNAFYSTKVMFANEIYEYASRIGADYETLREALYQSKWVGKNHLDVYYRRSDWKVAKRGLWGACLPKDLEAIAEHSQSKLLNVVKELNEKHKSKG